MHCLCIIVAWLHTFPLSLTSTGCNWLRGVSKCNTNHIHARCLLMGWAIWNPCQFLTLGHSCCWQNRHIIIHAVVELKLLVLLKSCLLDCIFSRMNVDRQADTQNDYSNPCCACALKINEQSCWYSMAYEHQHLCEDFSITSFKWCENERKANMLMLIATDAAVVHTEVRADTTVNAYCYNIRCYQFPCMCMVLYCTLCAGGGGINEMHFIINLHVQRGIRYLVCKYVCSCDSLSITIFSATTCNEATICVLLQITTLYNEHQPRTFVATINMHLKEYLINEHFVLCYIDCSISKCGR